MTATAQKNRAEMETESARRRIVRLAGVLSLACLLPVLSVAKSYTVQTGNITYATAAGISYSASDDTYSRERCTLDVYYPEGLTGCPVVVWFHGGGLTGGEKFVPEQLKGQGLVVVAANYRLLPKVDIDGCIDDAAAAVAWAFREAGKYGGDTKKIFVSGHSAGGYLTAMVGLDKEWLAKYGIDADSIAGLLPFSGQMISHYAYREMNGIGNLQPTIDRYAPLFHVRKNAPPMVLVTGDREMEMLGRYEENAYMWRMMKLAGNTGVRLHEIGGYDHGAMCEPSFHILLEYIKKYPAEGRRADAGVL